MTGQGFCVRTNLRGHLKSAFWRGFNFVNLLCNYCTTRHRCKSQLRVKLREHERVTPRSAIVIIVSNEIANVRYSPLSLLGNLKMEADPQTRSELCKIASVKRRREYPVALNRKKSGELILLHVWRNRDPSSALINRCGSAAHLRVYKAIARPPVGDVQLVPSRFTTMSKTST
jgi:hypothetical protein